MTGLPSRYVEPSVDGARVERLWSSVAERLERRPAQRWRRLSLALGVAGLAAAGVAGYALTARPESGRVAAPSLAAARLETASDALAVTLAEGSRLELSPRSAVSVRENRSAAVSLALASGRLVCDVTHRPGRSFVIAAADVEVSVIGTRFSVESKPEGGGARVDVSVERGVVEVRSRRRPGVVARVAAGQSWSQAGEQAGLGGPPIARPVLEPMNAPTPSALPSAAGSEASASTLRSAPTPRELFEKAGERRRAGDAPGAALAYEELLRRHPADARAGLSAFELGRLRMDRLSDSVGAISALERALALGVGPSFREDALARLVGIYAGQGDFGSCSRARERYLSSYPKGVHALAVASRCGSR